MDENKNENNNCNGDFFRALKAAIREFMENAKFEPTPAVCPKCDMCFYDFDTLIQHHKKEHVEFLNKFLKKTKDNSVESRIKDFLILHDKESVILLRKLAE